MRRTATPITARIPGGTRPASAAARGGGVGVGATVDVASGAAEGELVTAGDWVGDGAAGVGDGAAGVGAGGTGNVKTRGWTGAAVPAEVVLASAVPEILFPWPASNS